MGIAGIGFLVAVWCLSTYSGYVKPLFLPTPTGIWEGYVEFYQRQWLLSAVVRSVWRVTRSMILAAAVGIPIGAAMGAFPTIDALLRRIVNACKSVPTTGLIGLIILWFSIGDPAKIAFLFLGAIFYMVTLVRSAVLAVNQEYVRVAIDLGATPLQVMWRVLLPGALPQIWDAVAVCNGIMWTYIVLAEFINSSEDQLGLGYLLYIGGRAQQSGEVFAALILIAVISAGTDACLGAVRRRFLTW